MRDHIEMPKAAPPTQHALTYHHERHGVSDTVAWGFVMCAEFIANVFFAGRYGHRAVVLETIAAVPGMVGATLQRLKALRWIRDDRGWIKTLLDEAENERIHLMVFSHIACPGVFERVFIMVTQFVFYNVYFFIYLFSSRTAHRIVGYLEERAVHSYTQYLAEVEADEQKNVKAPALAIMYWKLPESARLADVIGCVREDEMNHRDVNHTFANKLSA